MVRVYPYLWGHLRRAFRKEAGPMVWTADHVQQIEAAPEDVGLSSAGMARLQRHIQAYVDAGKCPGAISMVQRRGKVVHFQTYGRRDLEAGTPVEPETLFRIYSMPKPIVSVGLMTLYEEGRFQLDDPVAQYISPFRDLKVLTGGTGNVPPVREPGAGDDHRGSAAPHFGSRQPVRRRPWRRLQTPGPPYVGVERD